MLALALALSAAFAQDASSTATVAPSPASPDQPIVRSSEIGWQRPLGLGLAVGNVVGLTGKRYLDERALTAIDVTVGAHTPGWAYGGLFAQGTWSVRPVLLIDSPDVELAPRVGVGGFLGYNDWNNHTGETSALTPLPDPGQGFLGARAVLGLDADLVAQPLQIFAEAALQTTLVPRLWPSLGVQAGARWYF